MNCEDQALAASPPPKTLAWSELFDGAQDSPVQPFVPFLDEAGWLGSAPALHLLGREGGMEDIYRPVWTFDAAAGDDVGLVFAWMWSRPDLWLLWGRAALGLGPAFLSSVVAREAGAGPLAPGLSAGGAADAAAPIGHDDDDDDDDDDADPEAGQLWCVCDDDGYGRNKKYRIFLRDGGPGRGNTFFSLRFDRASDRDRVWDWMQHYTGRYREFEAHFYAHGRGSLKKLIYGGMLDTERAVKKMGLGSGGARPLRFWPGPQTEASDA